MDYKVKIAKIEEAQRETEPVKRLKATEEYSGEPLRVLGVPFGGHMEGRDTDGEAFYDKTDIGLRVDDERPATYYHGFGPDDMESTQNPPVIIGMAKYTGQDERGHWFDVYLDESEELAKRIIEAEEAKASSGAVSHLVRYGKAGLIDVWPMGELAIFDTNEWRRPANELAVVEKRKSEEVAENAPEDVKTVKAALVETEDEQSNQPDIDQDTKESESIVEEEKKVENVEQTTEYVDKKSFDELKALIDERLPIKSKGAPAVIKELGEKDTTKGFMSFIRTGKENSVMSALKASNDTDMNIGTNVDGQYLVPTGFYQGVIARKDEMAIAPKVGVTEIPGVGTTVDVPYDNEADGEFIVTTETAEFDDDAPATGKKSLTFKKYSKTITISHELLRDEDAKLEAFLMDFVGRGMAKTHNDLLITEVESYGTSLKTFASATAVAIGELEAMMLGADMAAYLEGGNVNWVMSGPSYAKIISLTGDARTYAPTPLGSGALGQLLGHPVQFTNKADTIAASKKSIFFGDWSQVGVRNGAGLQIIRDPYTRAKYGQLQLHFLFDCVYGVLNSEAIGYGVHPSA